MPTQHLAGGRVEAEIHGAGPTLVLFHSLLADRTSWDGIVPALATQFQVVVPALPGFGTSEPTDGSLESVADRMAEALRDLPKPISLIGNGYGGFAALLMVIRHPMLVSDLILADAGACFSEPGRNAFRAMAMAAAAKGLEAIADTAMRRLFAPDFHAANPTLVAQRRDIFLQSNPEVIINACHALATMDLRPNLLSVAIPVLALVGSQDEATPPDMSRELADLLPDGKLTILENLAHVPQLQAPDQFLKAAMPFLKA